MATLEPSAVSHCSQYELYTVNSIEYTVTYVGKKVNRSSDVNLSSS